MNVQIKAKYVVIGALAFTGIAFLQSNKPLEYEFSSVYDGSKHHALIYTDSSNDRYNERCAEDLANNFIKAKLGEFDIEVVHNGEYDLVFYNGEKVK